jgi:hypothetical protein
MIEIPEAVNLAKQISETVKGKKIARVVAGLSPHKFAFYHGDPKNYDSLLTPCLFSAMVQSSGFTAKMKSVPRSTSFYWNSRMPLPSVPPFRCTACCGASRKGSSKIPITILLVPNPPLFQISLTGPTSIALSPLLTYRN